MMQLTLLKMQLNSGKTGDMLRAGFEASSSTVSAGMNIANGDYTAAAFDATAALVAGGRGYDSANGNKLKMEYTDPETGKTETLKSENLYRTLNKTKKVVTQVPTWFSDDKKEPAIGPEIVQIPSSQMPTNPYDANEQNDVYYAQNGNNDDNGVNAPDQSYITMNTLNDSQAGEDQINDPNLEGLICEAQVDATYNASNHIPRKDPRTLS